MKRIRIGTAMMAGALATAALAPAVANAGKRTSVAKTTTTTTTTTVSAPTAGTYCPARPLSQPFAQFGDTASYVQALGGTMERAADWTMTLGASNVAGNEPYYLNAATDTRALRITAGGSATGPWDCGEVDFPTLRFMVRNTGKLSGGLRLALDVRTTDGLSFTLPLGTMTTSTATWTPSAVVPTYSWLLSWSTLFGITAQPAANARLVLSDDGTGGTWEVDDVYVDPRRAL